ncbi:MAG TPA: SGNH hydrolase domain-containing protein, partial [Acidimicrobiales bacterium]|nr:SGNH hydrolase domain-containing protein [Acidimicrobiales bacterium]
HVLIGQAIGASRLPPDLAPSLAALHNDFGGPASGTGCWANTLETSVPSCVFGDPQGSKTVVLYGDSHAAMWFNALDDITQKDHLRLVVLTKAACGAGLLHFGNSVGWGNPQGEYAECDAWHRFALSRIQQIHPSLVIVSQEVDFAPGHRLFTLSQWRNGLEATLRRIVSPGTTALVLGDIPIAEWNVGALFPRCLSINAQAIHHCVTFPAFGRNYRQAEAQAAANVGVRYVNVIPWFCLNKCPAVIGHYAVYMDPWHVSATYTRFLEPLLVKSTGLEQLSAS